jgi:hypothetical protein
MDTEKKLREQDWVKSLVEKLKQEIENNDTSFFANVSVDAGRKLAYTNEIHAYRNDTVVPPEASTYETDMLFFDNLEEETWIPRLVVEYKLESVHTDDALTYSAKAATHKHVHPYLRYGILIGKHGKKAIPGRLFKHGTYFDFMATWEGAEPNSVEWKNFCALVRDEIEASRNMQELLTTSRSANRKKFQVIHRPLRFRAP